MPRMIPLALLALIAAVFVLSACDTFTGDTQIAQLETRNAQLQGTIDVLGTPAATIVALQGAATQNAQLQSQLSQAQNDSLAARATLTVLELSGGAAIQPTPAPLSAPPGDQSINLPTATSAPTGPQTTFTSTVTASARDAQDCPVNASATFDTTTDTIYVITRVNVLPAGSTIGARWTANGTLFYDDVACWTPDQDWYNICAYCSIVPDGGAFETGSWSVDLTLDSQLLSTVQFVVTDPNADEMDDSGAATTASDGSVVQ